MKKRRKKKEKRKKKRSREKKNQKDQEQAKPRQLIAWKIPNISDKNNRSQTPTKEKYDKRKK